MGTRQFPVGRGRKYACCLLPPDLPSTLGTRARSWLTISPRLNWREVAAAALGAALVAVVQFMPLIWSLGDRIPTDLGDPLPQAWQVAWGGHALLTQPLAFWQGNQFWPAADSLAFSDALVGYAPSGLIGSGVSAAVARYDLLFLFAYALAFLGTWLLSRELGAKPWAAAVAGAAFAYSPWRLEQSGHLHVVSSGGIPLALFLLLRGYRRASWKLILGGWAAAAWQVSIGFTLGLQFLYLLALLAVGFGIGWVAVGRPKQAAQAVKATSAGLLLLATTCAVIGLPYLRVQERYYESERSIATVRSFSPNLKAFITPPETSLVWSSVSRPLRDWRTFGLPEQILFPGLVILALALVGMFASAVPRRARLGLGAAVLVFWSLSLGIHTGVIGAHLPYRWVYEFLPGWRGARTPGRIHTLTTLGLALLAGFGATAASNRMRSRRSQATVAGLLCALVLVEGSGFPFPLPTVPKPPAALAGLKAPMFQLPAGAWDNRRYVLWSTDGFPNMINGRSSIAPPFFREAVRRTEHFPDTASINWLRSVGVKTVVVHTAEPAQAAAERRASVDDERYADSLKGGPGARLLRNAQTDARPTWQQATAKAVPVGAAVKRQLRRPLVIYSIN